jgi:hypothetical protein
VANSASKRSTLSAEGGVRTGASRGGSTNVTVGDQPLREGSTGSSAAPQVPAESAMAFALASARDLQ